MSRARRYAALATDLARAAVKPAPLPLKLTLCLTFRCNHRCEMCSIWSREKGAELSAAAIDRLFASIPRLPWLDLTGGEIVLRRDLAAIADSLHRRLRRLAMVHFPTNGLLGDAALAAARALRRRGGPKVIVTVSIDGPPPLHDEVRGLDGAFDRAVDTLRRLRAEPGVDVYAGLTLQPRNLDAVDATVTALAAAVPGFGPDDLHVNFLHTSPHYFANESAPRCDPDALATALSAFGRRRGAPTDAVRLIEWGYQRLIPAHLRAGASPIPCRAGELSAYVAPDGTVYACTIDPRPIGDLADHGHDLAALWRTAARRRMAAEARAGRCAGCWTPCEAYPTLLASPAVAARALLRPT